jgi:hypothetical protein
MTVVQEGEVHQVVIMGLFTIHSLSKNMDNLSLQIKGKPHLTVLFKTIQKKDFGWHTA